MDANPLPVLKARPTNSHKGTFGTVGIVGGCAGSPSPPRLRMIGAPALAANAAIRAGCGLVKVACPDSILNQVLAIEPGATGYPIGTTHEGFLRIKDTLGVWDSLINDSDSIVVGPGMGSEGSTQPLMFQVMNQTPPERCKAIIVDADAINALTALDPMPMNRSLPIIMTPHPEEAARILRAMGLQGNPAGTHEQRLAVAKGLAERLGCIMVLKGAGTIVSDGSRSWTSQRGHPCLATGGTGDVLAGMIGSVIAQTKDDSNIGLFDAACIAVDAHGAAGELWVSKCGTTAGLDTHSLCNLIPQAMQQYRSTSGH